MKKEKKTEYIGCKATPELKNLLMQIAEKEDRTLSYVICRILEDYVKTEETA